ncbi:MAG: PKD domain-containing protein [Candidatus Bipolaricaulia bacterium]
MRTRATLAAIACLFLLAGCATLNGLLGVTPPTAVISASPITGRAPLIVHLDAGQSYDDAGIVGTSWDFGDGASESSTAGGTVNHRYDHPGSYLVRLTVTDTDGETDGASVTITVENTPPVPSLRLSSDSPVIGERVQLDASGSLDPDGRLVDFVWEFGDGESMRGARVSHVYTEIAILTVRLTIEDDAGATASLVHTINVHNNGGAGGSGGGCR